MAVVFAADYTAETFDRPNLVLPGDENDLISAVAAANPRTVVVFNTDGPVVMPWLDRVRAVVEDWYPGRRGRRGHRRRADRGRRSLRPPAGHLPDAMAKSAISTPWQWPGTGLTSTSRRGSLVGYRYDHATRTKPLFPFGFGLSYTLVLVSAICGVARAAAGWTLSVRMTNTGRRSGTDVVQAYLTFPRAATSHRVSWRRSPP